MKTKLTLYNYLNKFGGIKNYEHENENFKNGYKRACCDVFDLLRNNKVIIELNSHDILVEK